MAVVKGGTATRRGGTPDPLDFRYHRTVGEGFADAAVLDPTNPTTVIVPIAGALGYRLRGLIATTQGGPPNPLGTLSFQYLRPQPDGTNSYTPYATSNPASVNVVAGTEFVVDIVPAGEAMLAITFTPAGGATATISVTYLDQMQV